MKPFAREKIWLYRAYKRRRKTSREGDWSGSEKTGRTVSASFKNGTLPDLFFCFKNVRTGLDRDAPTILTLQILTSIITDDPQIYNSLEHYLKENDLQNLSKLRLYQDDLLPLYKLCRLEREIDLATSRQVWLKSGGYLVIDPTEALTVIDVNTGKYSGKKLRRETLKTINLEAAKEAARQIRLRNLSGYHSDRFHQYGKQRRSEGTACISGKRLFADPVKTRLIDMTKLELVEITRKKVQ